MSILPKIIEKLAQFQQNMNNFLQQAGEKLVSILGDIKNFINAKLIKNLKKITKKFLLLFFTEFEDENYKDDETLSIFKSREIKKYLVNFIKNITRRDKNAVERSKADKD